MNAPTSKAACSDLPSQPEERREFLLDVFGQHLFSLRNQLTNRMRHYVEHEGARREMGSVPSGPYTAVASLDPAAREAALGLAREAVDRYMQLVLGLLQSSGQSLRLGQEHAIRYRLYAEVIAVEDYDTVLAESLINRGSEKAMESYFGRWLSRHADHEQRGAELFAGADSRRAFSFLRFGEIRCSSASSMPWVRRLRLGLALAAHPRTKGLLYARSYAIVFVSDMKRAVSFYRDVLGLPLRFESPGWTEFATDGATLALHKSEGANSAREDPHHERAGRCRPGLSVPDLDVFHKRMVEKNVPCAQEPKETFGVRIAQYVDPDGLAISVSEQKRGG